MINLTVHYDVKDAFSWVTRGQGEGVTSIKIKNPHKWILILYYSFHARVVLHIKGKSGRFCKKGLSIVQGAS
jgi:hypothetical protein